MRIGVISDIHGNHVALNAVLADIANEAVDQIVCLGDAIQGGPQPVEVVAELRELGCPVVMGNADAWLLTGKDTGAEAIPDARRQKMADVREWHLSLLSHSDQALIQDFKPVIELPLEGGRVLCCYHGSPRSFDEIILPLTPDEDVREYLEPRDDTVYTGGHTHVQFIRHLGRTFHFNPGSVGLAYRHDQPEDDFRFDPWAEYAILTSDGDRLTLEFRRVPIDVGKLITVYQSSGRPHAQEMIAQYQPR